MNVKVMAAIAVFAAGALSGAGVAEPRSDEVLLAQFGVDVRVPGGTVRVESEPDAEEAETSEPEDAAAAESQPEATAGFSGDTEDYADDVNGFKIAVPAEFELQDKGLTTTWIGPALDESATTIYINAASLPGVPAQTLYTTNQAQYENDPKYTEVEPVSVTFGDATVPGLRVKEVDIVPGTRDTKAADDIHRWHLLVFGNERVYTLGFTGAFQTFQDEAFQEVYNEAIASVELIEIVP